MKGQGNTRGINLFEVEFRPGSDRKNAFPRVINKKTHGIPAPPSKGYKFPGVLKKNVPGNLGGRLVVAVGPQQGCTDKKMQYTNTKISFYTYYMFFSATNIHSIYCE